MQVTEIIAAGDGTYAVYYVVGGVGSYHISFGTLYETVVLPFDYIDFDVDPSKCWGR